MTSRISNFAYERPLGIAAAIAALAAWVWNHPSARADDGSSPGDIPAAGLLSSFEPGAECTWDHPKLLEAPIELGSDSLLEGQLERAVFWSAPRFDGEGSYDPIHDTLRIDIHKISSGGETTGMRGASVAVVGKALSLGF